VLKTVEAYDLRSADPQEGAPYRDPDAGSAGKLARKTGAGDGETFAVEMPVDPDAVLRARAESDVALWEIMKKPVSLDAALHEGAGETVSGTISVTFETETQTVTETLERRLISRRE
jgi:hypothetical protein